MSSEFTGDDTAGMPRHVHVLLGEQGKSSYTYCLSALVFVYFSKNDSLISGLDALIVR